MAARPALRIEPLTVADWPSVRRIHADGIATGDATLEREPPDWDHFDRSHRHDCRWSRGPPTTGSWAGPR